MRWPTKKLAVTGVLSLSAFVVVKLLIGIAFQRPGEEALMLVPSEARAVMVLDIHPSFGQLKAFHKLAGAFGDTGLGSSVSDAFNEFGKHYPWIKDMLPFSRGSAVAVWMPGGTRGQLWSDQTMPLLIIPLSSVEGARKVAATELAADKDQTFKDKSGRFIFAFIDDSLVISGSSEDIEEVAQCKKGSKRSFVAAEGYDLARAAIEHDANLMLFIPPRSFRDMQARTTPAMGEALDSPGWLAMGMGLREDGISASANVPMNARKWQPYKDLASIKPIRTDLLSHLPKGAYSLAVASQPSAFWHFAEDTLVGDAPSERSLLDFAQSVDRQVGINFEESVMPAFSGNAVWATYPSQTDPDQGCDILILIDDSNGAKPADIVDRCRRFMEQQIGRNITGRAFQTLDIKNADAYGYSREVRLKNEDDLLRNASSGSRKFLRGKTLAFATVGNAFMVSSSEDLLQRSVAAYHDSSNNLNSDANISQLSSLTVSDPQLCFAINMGRLSNAATETVPWEDIHGDLSDLGKKLLTSFTNLDKPLVVSMSFKDDSVNAGIFLPLDFDAIATSVKDSQPQIDERLKAYKVQIAQQEEVSLAFAFAGAERHFSESHEGKFFPDLRTNAEIQDALKDSVIAEDKTSLNDVKWAFNPALLCASHDWVEPVNENEVPMFYGPFSRAHISRYNSSATEEGSRTVAFASGLVTQVTESEWASHYAIYTEPGMFRRPALTVATPPAPSIPMMNVQSSADPVELLIENSASHFISNYDLASLNEQQVRLVKNGIYARRGYTFKSPDLIAYFSEKPWYTSSQTDESLIASAMNGVEKANVKIIVELQNSRGWK